LASRYRGGLSEEEFMPISARNQLKGTVKGVSLGQVMAEVVVDVGGQEVVAAITRRSVESLGLKEGDSVKAVIKATEVMVMK
jgi:molybdopterin-binding protein